MLGYPKRFKVEGYSDGAFTLIPATERLADDLNLKHVHLSLDLDASQPRIIINVPYSDNHCYSLLSDIFLRFQERGNRITPGEYDDFKLKTDGLFIDTESYEIDRHKCVQILGDFFAAFFSVIKIDDHSMHELRTRLLARGYSLPESLQQSGLKEGSLFANTDREIKNEDGLPLYMLVL
jgi:hypothetical protein